MCTHLLYHSPPTTLVVPVLVRFCVCDHWATLMGGHSHSLAIRKVWRQSSRNHYRCHLSAVAGDHLSCQSWLALHLHSCHWCQYRHHHRRHPSLYPSHQKLLIHFPAKSKTSVNAWLGISSILSQYLAWQHLNTKVSVHSASNFTTEWNHC